MRPIYFRLSSCLLLIAAPLAAEPDGGWTLSPTLDLGGYQTQLESDDPVLRRKGTVLSGELDTVLDYDGRYYDTSLHHNVRHVEYDWSDDSRNFHEMDWRNNLALFDEKLKLGHHWQRWDESYAQVQGIFDNKDIYRAETDAIRTNNTFLARYDFPQQWSVRGNVRGEWSKQGLDHKNKDYNAQKNYDFRGEKINWKVMQMHGFNGVNWEWLGGLQTSERKAALTFSQDHSSLSARLPLFSQWHLAAKGSVQQYESSNTWAFGGSDRKVLTFSRGAGVAWIRPKDGSMVQVLAERTDDRDNGDNWSLALDVNWTFLERWALSAYKSYRFYGDVYGADFSYLGERHVVTLSFSENADIRYIPTVKMGVDAVYICTPGDQPLTTLDPQRCVLPPVGEWFLEPGQVIFSDIVTYYPLEPKLSLYKEASVKWDFSGQKWEHRILLEHVSDRDLILDDRVENYLVDANGDWRLNAQSYLRFRWRYAHWESTQEHHTATDRLYSAGYHFELNRHSEWSVSLQHVDARTANHSYDYRDSRVFLNYRYMFGKKHKGRRDLFPSD